MIRAEKANQIMQLYEDDYDNFLDKLKAKRKAKKEAAKKTKAEADKADKTVSEAEAHKKIHLDQKVKNLINKAGGIEGTTDSVKNALKYLKSDVPSDYSMSVGDPPPEKKIFGLPAMFVYAGGVIILLGCVYGVVRYYNRSLKPALDQVPRSTKSSGSNLSDSNGTTNNSTI
jgi:hypothetical protein